MIATGMEDSLSPRGESLRDRLQSCLQEGRPGLPVSELIGYISAVAHILDTPGRPHGEVTPDTIRIDAGRAVLSTEPVADRFPSPGRGTVRGAPVYMAPEVWGGMRTAGSDQYALACTYAELRAGHPPFRGASVLEVMQAHLESDPDLAGCSDAERRVLARALAKTPGQRFPTCLRFAEELRQAVALGAA